MAISPLEHWKRRIDRRIRLHDLHVLLVVVQSGSMAKAARGLAVSQPAVSKAIANLEHTLRVRLLDRGAQGIEPTAYGKALVRRGMAVFDELHQGVQEIEFMADATVGEVRIGCNESLASALLPEVVRQLARHHPGITLHVTPMSHPITLEIRQLRERNVDLIIGRGVFPIPEDDVNAEGLFKEPLLVVTGARNRWAHRRKLALADLVEAKWILFPTGEAPGALVEQAFQRQGLAVPRARVTTSSFHLRDMLLLADDYLTVVPACMLRVLNAKRPTVKALPVDLGIGARPIAVFTLKNRTLSPVTELFTECVRKAVASATFRSLTHPA